MKRLEQQAPVEQLGQTGGETAIDTQTLMFIMLTTMLMMLQNRKTEILLRTVQNSKMNLQKQNLLKR